MPNKPKTHRLPYLGRPRAAIRRGSAASRGYDARWRKYRKWFLAQAENVMCKCGPDCCPEGCHQVSTVVDHKIPHKGDQQLFWDPGNHQGLSKSCHDRKTAKEGGFKKKLGL